jgi:hypothetical protein
MGTLGGGSNLLAFDLDLAIAATPFLTHLAASTGYVWPEEILAPCLLVRVQPRISSAARGACLDQ